MSTTETTNHSNDSVFYLYQNPRTGTVSSQPMSVRQLVPLVMANNATNGHSILPPNTQCLAVTTEEITEQHDASQDATAAVPPKSFSYGDTWQSISELPVLKEAACTEWYWTRDNTTHGPGSCRHLLEAWDATNRDAKMMVYAQTITPQWMPIVDLPHLQHVLEILQNRRQQQQQQQQDVVADNTGPESAGDENKSKEIQDELEAFLHGVGHDKEDQDETDAYQSDGGTNYIKDPRTGNLVHEALAPPEARDRMNGKAKATESDSHASDNQASNATTKLPNKKNKSNSKKPTFKKSNAKHWIYASGLPTDGINEQDVAKYFGKAGLLELDPLTLQPKVKLYRDKRTEKLKGDASICYAHTTSVDLALQVLDESWWDDKHQLHVERANFEAKGDVDTRKRPASQSISQAQRKVARLALKQAQDEGLGDAGRLAGGRKGLRIIVVKHLLEVLPSDDTLEQQLHAIFAKFGEIEKMTAITETNVVIVKYVEPVAASEAIDELHGSKYPKDQDNDTTTATSTTILEAIYWDGVTDYTTKGDDYDRKEKEEEQRHEEFGKWLETSQDELPPELQLQVAGEQDS